MSTLSAESLLAQDMGRFFDDPLGFVMYAYPWDTDPELQVCKLLPPYDSLFPNCKYGPDLWACDALSEIGAEVRKHGFVPGGPSVDPIRFARASGHGIGKSAFVAWIVNWIMSTRPGSQGTVTANTATQLATKTWAQIIKWTKKCITAHWFDVTTGKGNMRMARKGQEEKWFCSAQTCDKDNSQSFAGQHAVTATSFYVVDEASEVPDEIEVQMKGGLTDGEPMQFLFGNPTSNTGFFHGAFHGQRHRYNVAQIDSREVQITNKAYLQEMIDDYGIDSDLVKIRVRGMFPKMSAKQFISVEDVDAAIKRHLRVEQYDFAPKILTLDNAWEGDDEGVIGLRQGLYYRTLRFFAKNDNDIQIANLLAQLEDEHKADAVFIDAGYGTGVYSAGTTLGREWQLVWFGAESPKPGYLNLRAYMWGEVRDWLKAGGALDPKDKVLYSDLVSPWTVPRMDGVIQLEAKKDMKRRLLPSPGRGDALAISFAFPVQKKVSGAAALMQLIAAARERTPDGHDPYADVRNLNSAGRGHDPYSR